MTPTTLQRGINYLLLTLIMSYFCFGQTEEHRNKFNNLESDIWMNIWDKENSTKLFKIETLGYDDIPKNIDFRGTIVEALKWTDLKGENILIQTVSGEFNSKNTEYDENISELYAYLFQKNKSNSHYKLKWRVYDYELCDDFMDIGVRFIQNATTITDIDNDGEAEISLPYVLICRTDMSTGRMKIIMYEGSTKYAFRGSTMLFCGSGISFGGEYSPSENLKTNEKFMGFLKSHWDRNKCEM